ncbi:MAG: RDD family protein [Acidobacteriota bacterium]|nr:RDD family protein [Blastocatellia bacterium]MDW8239515.1 RDD family protein [Acidobacteriota bacterium]
MMKCGTCGYVDHADSRMCKGCGRIAPHPVLIPFPVAASVAQNLEPASPPAWKVELQERINAIRARRKLLTALHQAAEHPAYPPLLLETSQGKAVHPAIAAVHRRFAQHVQHHLSNDSPTLPDAELRPGRASANADCSMGNSTASLTTGSPQDGKPSATAQAATELAQKKPSATNPTSDCKAVAMAAQPGPTEDVLETLATQAELDGHQTETSIESWIERMDQQARCRFTDDSLATLDSREDEHILNSNHSPERQARTPASANTTHAGEFPLQQANMSQRVAAGLIDLGVMVMANVPFLAMSEFSRANFSDIRVLCIHALIALILYFLYMSLMLMAMGQTIGMHKVGIIAVDAVSLNQPSFGQAIRRACALMVAPIGYGLSFLSPRFDTRGRSFSDMASRTTVHQTYEELPAVQAPWLYHHCRP